MWIAESNVQLPMIYLVRQSHHSCPLVWFSLIRSFVNWLSWALKKRCITSTTVPYVVIWASGQVVSVTAVYRMPLSLSNRWCDVTYSMETLKASMEYSRHRREIKREQSKAKLRWVSEGANWNAERLHGCYCIPCNIFNSSCTLLLYCHSTVLDSFNALFFVIHNVVMLLNTITTDANSDKDLLKCINGLAKSCRRKKYIPTSCRPTDCFRDAVSTIISLLLSISILDGVRS